jgi:hypothetical protein
MEGDGTFVSILTTTMSENNIPQRRREAFFAGAPNLDIRPPRLDGAHVMGPLTDKKIAEYERAGWYGAEAARARKARAEKKLHRKGNFLEVDGRSIYCPQ